MTSTFRSRLPPALQRSDINALRSSDLQDVVYRGETMVVVPRSDSSSELCSFCSDIPLDPTKKIQDFKPQTMFMHRMLNNRENKCRLCTLLFRAFCKQDPFKHPAIKDHLPENLRGKTYEEWATAHYHSITSKMSPKSWPFGARRDAVQVGLNEDNTAMDVKQGKDSTEDLVFYGAVTSNVASTTVQTTVRDRRAAQWVGGFGSVLPTISAKISRDDKKLPVIIKITPVQPRTPGERIIDISMHAFGCRFGAPLSVISNFSLCVMPAQATLAGNQLVYGRKLQNIINLSDCKSWMECCMENHTSQCNKSVWPTSQLWPDGNFRLICTQEERLVDLAEVNLDRWQYAALSYVWGLENMRNQNRSLLQLTRNNLDELKQPERLRAGENNNNNNNNNMQTKTPPMRVIQDAMHIARQLGIRYLWADSLCIMQDDAKEKKRQLDQMDRIYSCAAITLVSSHTGHAEMAIPGVLKGRSMAEKKYEQISETINNAQVLLPIEYPTDLGIWATRAWTMQEMLLSRRLLIFGNHYASFHCRVGTMREDMPADPSRGIDAPHIPWMIKPDDSILHDANLGRAVAGAAAAAKSMWDGSFRLLRTRLFTEYTQIISEFTARRMTKVDDGINAVQGLLRALDDAPPGGSTTSSRGYIQGLPIKHLDAALLWQPPADGSRQLKPRHGEKEKFASWSWAGWTAGHCSAQTGGGGSGGSGSGIRYEPPFRVFTDHHGILKKVQDTSAQAEERIKPCVQWYTVECKPGNIPATRPSPTPPPRSSRTLVPSRPSPTSSSSPRPLPTVPSTPPRPPPRPVSVQPVSTNPHEPQSLTLSSFSSPSVPTHRRKTTLSVPPPPPPPPKAKQPPPPLPPRSHKPPPPPKLIPINGHGLGASLTQGSKETSWFLEDAVNTTTTNTISNIDTTSLDPDLHLVCVTQVATLSIGTPKARKEMAWKKKPADGTVQGPEENGGCQTQEEEGGTGTALNLMEAPLYEPTTTHNNAAGAPRRQEEAIGYVIPTSSPSSSSSSSTSTALFSSSSSYRSFSSPSSHHHASSSSSSSLPARGEFIVLSEAQYLGTEDRVDVCGFPYYNVMLVEREEREEEEEEGMMRATTTTTRGGGGGERIRNINVAAAAVAGNNNNVVCRRLGVGKVRKDVWRRLEGLRKGECVVLG